MNGVPVFQVDAFADRPFRGNPAAVCLLPSAAGERWMRDVAREMNLSETAFLHRKGDAFRLRWFTPSVEVNLCGHATLASAHVLWEEGLISPRKQARFLTRSGLLTARRSARGWIELDFPSEPAKPVQPPPGLFEGLGARPIFVGRSRFDYLAQLESEEAVRGLKPNFRVLAALPEHRGVCVTAISRSRGRDFVSRFFAPAAGIGEDPVTGSTHCMLGPFWSERLGKSELVGFQASARGGAVRVELRGGRALLSGQAVTVLKGRLLGDPMADSPQRD
ncbi:MAG: PhzF family phenazine biosynthesis protein [Elusimicrobia bacterium]|nr:PhzF family phenazine biosynthesis protein [Elusimicrobiota bacterium]